MANICDYNLKAVGSKESLEEFSKIINFHYERETDTFSHNVYLSRVENDYTEDMCEIIKDDTYSQFFGGTCAWSVHSCMLEGGFSYYSANLKDGVMELDEDGNRRTSLLIESKRLGLTFEVFSEECGCCFAEHYIIKDGKLTTDETVDFMEYFFDDEEEFPTKESVEKEYDITITENEWQGKIARRGGYDDVDFTI